MSIVEETDVAMEALAVCADSAAMYVLMDTEDQQGFVGVKEPGQVLMWVAPDDIEVFAPAGMMTRKEAEAQAAEQFQVVIICTPDEAIDWAKERGWR